MADALGERSVDESMREKTITFTSGDVPLEKLAVPERIRQIKDEPGRMTNTAAVSFFTAYAYRLFRKNYYFLSLKIFDRSTDAKSMDRLATAQQDFLAGVEALAKDYAQWLCLDNTLARRQFSDIVELSPACTHLRQAFIKMDRFLIPPYLARTGGLIAQPELALITEGVGRLVKELLVSIDDKRSAAVGAHPTP